MLTLALDSGAHSLFHKYAMPHTKGGVSGENIDVEARIRTQIDSSYFRSDKFKKYFNAYVAFAHKHAKQFQFVVTLDAIFDPKISYEMTMELTKNGLTPLPVLHPGEDHVWLKKYMDKFDYVGLGGLGQFVSTQKYLQWGNKAFSMLCDSKGRPQYRVHGFAMAATELIARWPWASVDASSPFVQSRNGAILIPYPVMEVGKRIGWDFLRKAQPVWTTDRRWKAKRHYGHLSSEWRAVVDALLAQLDVTVEETRDYVYRDYVNLFYTYSMEQAVQKKNQERFGPKWKFSFYISGKPSQSEELFLETLPILRGAGIDDVKYLGTFFLPKPVCKFLEQRKVKIKPH